MTMYFNPLKVLMPLGLTLLGLGLLKGVYDQFVHPLLLLHQHGAPVRQRPAHRTRWRCSPT